MTMEPSEAVEAIERSLRLAVRAVAPNDWQQSLTPEAFAKLEEKRRVDLAKRDGTVASADLLDYTETEQLLSLVLKEWPRFQPILDDKRRTEAYFDLVRDYRNSAQHNREMLGWERDLLSGAAGQIRNQVALYRGTTDGPARYYPLIESVIDQAGRQSYIGASLQSVAGIGSVPVRYDVGDEVTIRARAVSARGRLNYWSLVLYGGLFLPRGIVEPGTASAEGDDVELDFRFTEQEVGEDKWLAVLLYSDSKYHRHNRIDDVRYFPVHVNPPEYA